jgi:hypothetical protein
MRSVDRCSISTVWQARESRNRERKKNRRMSEHQRDFWLFIVENHRTREVLDSDKDKGDVPFRLFFYFLRMRCYFPAFLLGSLWRVSLQYNATDACHLFWVFLNEFGANSSTKSNFSNLKRILRRKLWQLLIHKRNCLILTLALAHGMLSKKKILEF